MKRWIGITLLLLVMTYNACDMAGFEAVKPNADFFQNLSSQDVYTKVNEGRANKISIPFGNISQVQIDMSWSIIDVNDNIAARFQPAEGAVTVRIGDNAAVIDTQITEDTLYKGEEDFALVLQWIDPVSGEKKEKRNLIKVIDSKLPPQLKVVTTQSKEGTDLIFKVELSEIAFQDVSFEYQTMDGSALKDKDYTAAQGGVVIPAGSLSYQIIIKTIDDNVHEGNQEMGLKITNVTFADLSADFASGVITSDDLPPTINISQPTVNENMSATIGYSLSHPSDSNISFAWKTRNGSAIAGADYESASGNVAIAAGSMMGQISIKIMDDNLDENTEDFFIDYTGAMNAQIASVSTIKIAESDLNMAPTLSISAQTFSENAGNVPVVYTLSKPSGRNLTFNIGSVNKTAVVGDFYVLTSVQTISAGQTMGMASVQIVNDSNYEPQEKFDIVVGSLDNSIRAQAEMTINDDDPQPRLSISNMSTYEGSTTFVRVSLSGSSYQNITFNYTTSDGTAKSGSDYVAKSGSATITAGQFFTDLQISSVQNSLYEKAETYAVSISGAQGATISNSIATITLNDDESYPYFTWSQNLTPYGDPQFQVPCFIPFGVNGVNCFYQITFTMKPASEYTVQASWSMTTTTGGSASGSLNFPPGTTVRSSDFQLYTTVNSFTYSVTPKVDSIY